MSGLGVRRAKAALSDYCFAVSATLSSSHNPTSNSADFERGSKTNVPQKRRSARQPKRCHAWSIQCGDAGQAHCRGREASYSGRRMAGKDSHMGLACDPCRDQGVWRGRVMSTRVDPAELGNVAAQLLFLRRRGGQPGNQNAVTHGRFSTPTRAARKAAREESDRQHAEWMKTIPKTDYGAICEAIKAHDRGKPRYAPIWLS